MVFRQPLDGEPMGTLGERGPCRLADVDRAVVEHHDDRCARPSPMSAGGQRLELVQCEQAIAV
jgi:hypothetical protein